jgi:hypothetical protein
MSDSENEDETALLKIDNSVWETPNQAPSRIFIEHRPRFRKLLDTIDRKEDFPEELLPKARPFLVVVLDRVVKLNLRNLKESDIHLALYSARTSSAEIVAAAPAR